MQYTCAGCGRPVSQDNAFRRSINLRTVAWCSPCWRERHTELFIPGQRESSVDPAPGVRRWVRSRQDAAS
jgi:hypothetical protein